MNEFAQKKIGEVLAFARLGIELTERSGSAATTALGGEKHSADFIEAMTAYRDTLETDGSETTLEKAQKTTEKLREMMERYIGDEWDNPTEVMEWLGFYSGAAVVHWALVLGAAEAQEDEILASTSEQAIDLYTSLLEAVKEQLHAQGQDKAS